MTVYRNGAEVQLELPDHAPELRQPILRLVPDQVPGARLYSVGEYHPTTPDALYVTPAGHWYHVSDPSDGYENWICRGCRVVGCNGWKLDEHGKCPNPPSMQEIASALFARFARPAPAKMHAQQRRIRFIRTAVAA